MGDLACLWMQGGLPRPVAVEIVNSIGETEIGRCALSVELFLCWTGLSLLGASCVNADSAAHPFPVHVAVPALARIATVVLPTVLSALHGVVAVPDLVRFAAVAPLVAAAFRCLTLFSLQILLPSASSRSSVCLRHVFPLLPPQSSQLSFMLPSLSQLYLMLRSRRSPSPVSFRFPWRRRDPCSRFRRCSGGRWCSRCGRCCRQCRSASSATLCSGYFRFLRVDAVEAVSLSCFYSAPAALAHLSRFCVAAATPRSALSCFVARYCCCGVLIWF